MKEDKNYEEEARELSRKLLEMFMKHSDEESAKRQEKNFVLFDANGASDCPSGIGLDLSFSEEEEDEGQDYEEEVPIYRFYLDVGMDKKLAELFADKLANAITSLNAFLPTEEGPSVTDIIKACTKKQ